MTKYMHTIEGKPAMFWPEHQICYAERAVVLCDSLEQIRRERRKSRAWRKKNGYPLFEYGYVKVSV